MSKDFSIIFMGSPEFACPSLEALNENFNVKAVVTGLDKPAGRGQKLQELPVKKKAVELGIPVLQPKNLKDPEFQKELKSYNADLFVVLAFRMLPASVFEMPPKGTINLHASLLPQYRGAAPINWAIMNGEEKTGLTTFFIQQEIDTGGVILREEMSIAQNETAGSLHDRMMQKGASLLVQTVQLIEQDNYQVKEQSELGQGEELKEAPKLFKETCRIDWTKTAEQVHNHIRGLHPFPTATSILNLDDKEVQVKLHKSAISDESCHVEPGKVKVEGKKLWVACADKWLEIEEIQTPGKRKMEVKSWINGVKMPGKLVFS